MSFAQGWEWLIILAIVLLLFGGRKLPELSRSLGQSIRGFRDEMGDDDEAQTLDGRPESTTKKR